MPRGENLAVVDRVEAGRKGGLAKAAALRAKREAAEQMLIEDVDHVVRRLRVLVDSEDESVAARAITHYLDRVLGRAVARLEHSGRVEVDIAVVRGKLDTLIAREAERQSGR